MPIIFFGLLLLSFGTYRHVRNTIEKEFTRNMLVTTGKTADGINTWLKTLLLEPETIAATPTAKKINTDFKSIDIQNISRYKLLHGKYPDIFEDIYAANRLGEYHTVLKNGDSYSLFVGTIANRGYFQAIMAGSPALITPPLVSRTTGKPTIFIVAPITDNEDRPQGLIGTGISLQYVRTVAEKLKAYKSGYGIVLDRDGRLIYHPDEKLILQKSLARSDESSIRELNTRMTAGGSGMYRYVYNGQEKMAFYQPIPINGWSVATVVPVDELYGSANRLLWIMALTTLLLALSVGAVIFIAADRLTRPLHALASHAQLISSGNLDPGILTVTHHDEVGLLTDTFNIMTGNLKHTMDVIQQSEVKFRSLVENINVGIYRTTFDSRGHLLQVNEAMVRMFGYDSEEKLLAVDLADLYRNQEDRVRIVEALQSHGSIKDRELCLLKKDGVPIWCLITANVEYDARGGVKWVNGFIDDITERKVLADQLRQAQKMEAIGTLAGGIAHDFNNMLAPIYVYSEMIRQKFAEDDVVHKRASAILAAAGKAKDLVRQLLSFSRKQILAMSLLDLNEVVAGFNDILQRTIRESIPIRLNLSSTPCPITADRTQMEQILLNLAVNAQDAIAEAGSIIIETGQVLLDDEYCQLHPGARPGWNAMLAVTDSGSGMDDAILIHIFEPFYSTKVIGKGTGLGLATVYGIIKQHNGFIDVKSKIGEGTIFRIFLPLATGEPKLPVQPVPHPRSSIQLGNATILLVEDNEMVMDMTRELLENSGCTVLSASLPEDAIACAGEYDGRINLLLSDVIMPQMNGPELHGRLKEIFPDLPVLYMSGYSGNVVVEHGTLEEEASCINKPFTAETLLEAVAQKLA
jgi:PAS domain S-box-containing protein